MKTWKIILISFLITIATNFIPIERPVRYSHECMPENDQSCFKKNITYGLPFRTFEPTYATSPAGTIHWYEGFIYLVAAIKFIPNWIIFALIIKLFFIIKKYITEKK